MGDIETLQNKILGKVQATGEAKVQELQKELSQALEDYKNRLNKQFEHDKENFIRKQEQQFEIRKQSLANELRNSELTHKQKLLEEIIQDVPNQLNHSIASDLNQMIQSAIQKLDTHQAFELKIGEKSRQFISDDQANELHATFDNMHWGENIAKKSGFILTQAGMNMNYLFEDVINELKPQLLIELEKQLKA
ncbi:hypothetical protein [Facklamia miroungae]|uniref:V/A-type H+-transporting ATPase subunit E n=1 Tax=Facklamia miroungae TaxID=120956 RepID=A0A1G7RJJ8_9LACT|nr:hypothetical protein [Facklamia miroungae]NKZ29389.1 hypothetical protein [Facklamia miroungae]SDG10932.1 hypothetical protein SAMN05421791_10366 [Facklamia miroungae]